MTKEEFYLYMTSAVAKFKAFWEEGHEMVPDDYPVEMNVADWIDQFESFMSGLDE
jgi:hypothetical protein